MSEVVPRVRERLFAELGLALPRSACARTAACRAARSSCASTRCPLARGELAPADWPAAGERLGDEILALMRRYGHELLGVQETQALLDGLERTHPALVREVVPKLVSPVLLADVLRRLVEEGVSLRNLRDILGALAEWAPHERDPVVLAEHVRAALRRAITFQHVRAGGVLPAYMLDGLIEDTIRDAIHKTPTGSYLALEPQLSRDIVGRRDARPRPRGRAARPPSCCSRTPRSAATSAASSRPSTPTSPSSRTRSSRPRPRFARWGASASADSALRPDRGPASATE